MENRENKIEIREQPMTKVKFRMVVHSHHCQSSELLLGQNGSFPRIQLIPSDQNCKLRPETVVRMSLVDVTSTATNILDHYHCLVDCQGSRIPTWSVQKPMSYDGTVCFDKFGIVKSLEDEKVDKVAERMIARQVEKGDLELNSSIWRRTQIRSLAEQRCRTTTSSKLKLCFEAFLMTPDKIVEVAQPVFSEPVTDLVTYSLGELSITMMSICSDNVEGGSLLMTYTGNSNNKVNFTRSSFYADFIQLQDPNNLDSEQVWSKRVFIPESQLHPVGQHLGGLWLQVPTYDFGNNESKPCEIDKPVICHFQVVKTKKNKFNDIEAKSDFNPFTYKPSITIKMGKRKVLQESQESIMNKLARFQQPPVASVSVTFSQQSGLGASGAGVIRRMATIPEINSPSPLSPNIPVIQPRTPTAQLYDLNINSPVQVMVPSPQPVIQQHHHQQQQQQQMRSFNQVQQTVSPSLKDIPSDVLDFLGTLDDNQGQQQPSSASVPNMQSTITTMRPQSSQNIFSNSSTNIPTIMVPLNNDPGYWQQGTFNNPTNIFDDILCSETDGNSVVVTDCKKEKHPEMRRKKRDKNKGESGRKSDISQAMNKLKL